MLATNEELARKVARRSSAERVAECAAGSATNPGREPGPGMELALTSYVNPPFTAQFPDAQTSAAGTPPVYEA